MSQRNVEVVRRSYQAFNENGLAGASEFWDAWIVSVREEKITHVRSFFDTDRAVEAAGLSE